MPGGADGQPVQPGIDFVHDMHNQNDTMQISDRSEPTQLRNIAR
jgi:hypothetical protein